MPFTDSQIKPDQQQHAQQPVEHAQKKKRIKKRVGVKRVSLILIAVVVTAALGFFVYGYFNTRNELMSIKNSSSSSGASEVQQLIDKVGKLVQLPAGEAPTLATVSNVAQLKNQQFFAMAKDGDKLLIYSKSGLGVLYRPSTNKVISYSPINLSNK